MTVILAMMAKVPTRVKAKLSTRTADPTKELTMPMKDCLMVIAVAYVVSILCYFVVLHVVHNCTHTHTQQK